MRRILRAAAAALLVTALAAGCGDSDDSSAAGGAPAGDALSTDTEYSGSLDELPTSYPEPEDEDLTIGWLNPNGAVESLSSLGEAIEIATEQRGGSLVTLDAGAKPDEQVTQMQQLIDRKVDAIIVWPLDAGALGPVVKRATAAGIPVVAVEANSDIAATDLGGFTSQITLGTDYIGFMTAREMARQQPGGKVVVAGFVVPVPFITAVTEAQASWAEEFGLDVVDTVQNQTDDVAGGSEAVAGATAQHPDLKGVLAYSDATAIGASLAGREAGLQLTTIGTNGASDAFEAIRSGRLFATMQWPLADWADQLTAGAYVAAQKPDEKLPITVYPTGMALVTADNIDDAIPFEEQLEEMRNR
ncbi:sugar ABC transporter substrate-binding protein [Nocardioides soli]|uniref:Ribose transport system substrate-binding protein n=1 Tax=Nocardioides soli TaxID=1036020 RepID=A0A7W4VW28_9ACTN|nr:sugar ABC transporter substrate-binding protein [Nocardioides soli]MBB3042402.1 ribose transport system substrate-binding protein [Nocardioides soli]